jgi:hypothetical protein
MEASRFRGGYAEREETRQDVISELRILRKAKKQIWAESRKPQDAKQHPHFGTSAYGIRVLLLNLDRSSVAL